MTLETAANNFERGREDVFVLEGEPFGDILTDVSGDLFGCLCLA